MYNRVDLYNEMMLGRSHHNFSDIINKLNLINGNRYYAKIQAINSIYYNKILFAYQGHKTKSRYKNIQVYDIYNNNMLIDDDLVQEPTEIENEFSEFANYPENSEEDSISISQSSDTLKVSTNLDDILSGLSSATNNINDIFK